MEDAIKHFPQQFEFNPKVENEDRLSRKNKFIVSGMGGSHLGAWLLKMYDPNLDLLIHRDYGLPRVPEYFLKESLIILSSYSGDTEEVLDCADMCLKRGYSLAVVAGSGKLLDFARTNHLPYITLPVTGIEPRMAIGFTMIALSRFMHDERMEEQIKFYGNRISPTEGQAVGEDLAKVLVGKIPLVYSSTLNLPVAYNWKIKFNETAKIPAFYNVFPEFNHNELSGFDVVDSTADLSSKFNPIFLVDNEDHPRIKERMNIMERLFLDRKINVTRIPFEGENVFAKIFRSVLIGEWASLTLAKHYGVPDAKTPLIAEFKKKMSEVITETSTENWEAGNTS